MLRTRSSTQTGRTAGTRGPLYAERPQVWRALTPILQASTYDEQRAALATAVSFGRGWVEAAITTGAVPGVPEPQP